MAIYRLALLVGDATRLSACTVSEYKSISAPSYKTALAIAKNQNAIVIGWRGQA